MRPFIGLTCSAEEDGSPVVRPAYVQAVHKAGGRPVPLPFARDTRDAQELLEGLSGLILTGSEDLDPSLWGETLHPEVTLMHPNRQESELSFCKVVLDYDLPVLAVCGGMQTLNVVAGGTLHQHLPDREEETLEHRDPELLLRHEVLVESGTRLEGLVGSRLETNSNHHQAVAKLAPGFIPAAHSSDGVIEAFEHPGRWIVAVEWHPERMIDDPLQAELFGALVDEAMQRQAGPSVGGPV